MLCQRLVLTVKIIGSESYSGKRVIRYEEGKEAEIFTLVLDSTMEVNWFNTSSNGKSYIEISESELDEILSGKTSNNIEKEGKETDLLFRL